MNGKTLITAILVILGGFLALKIIGVALGTIIFFLFPFILMGLGYIGMKNDKTFIGGILFAIGLIMLLSKLSGMIYLLAAIALIVWGVSLLMRKKNVY
ncbi:hypothetical protein AB6A23_03180 [Paenibacillus tarimensis]